MIASDDEEGGDCGRSVLPKMESEAGDDSSGGGVIGGGENNGDFLLYPWTTQMSEL